MGKQFAALIVALTLPVSASADPLRDAAERAGRELTMAQSVPETRSRTRVWTAWGLIAGGGVLTALGGLELVDDEDGPDDAEDLDDSDDGEDSDGWGNGALIGGGIAAATLGGVLLLTGPKSGPVVSARPGRITVRHTLRF
jgi:hypothetical protein